MSKKFNLLLIVLLIIGLGFTFRAERIEASHNILLAHSVPESHAYHEGYLMFKELVEERTDGEITVQIFPNNTLGGDLAAADSVRMGNIQMALTGTFSLYQTEPKWGVFDLPFLFSTYEQVDTIIEGEIGQELLNEDLGNVMALDFMENGFRFVTNSERPIHDPSDLNGLRIRTMESPVYLDSWEAMGANPTAMPFGEVYTALDTGVVDGQETPPSLLYSMGFHEIQDYLTTTNHLYLAGITIINKNFFESLSSEFQDIVTTSFSEAAAFQRDLVREEDVKALEQLREELEVIELDEESRQPFVESTYPVYEKYADRIGRDFLINFLETIGKDEVVEFLLN